MNISELLHNLRVCNVRKSSYGVIDLGTRDNKLCLEKVECGFEVYYPEKGIKEGIKFFDNEHDACAYFWTYIQNEPEIKLLIDQGCKAGLVVE